MAVVRDMVADEEGVDAKNKKLLVSEALLILKNDGMNIFCNNKNEKTEAIMNTNSTQGYNKKNILEGTYKLHASLPIQANKTILQSTQLPVRMSTYEKNVPLKGKIYSLLENVPYCQFVAKVHTSNIAVQKYVPTPNILDNQNNYSDTDSKKAEDYTVDSNVQNFENEDINSYLSYNTNSEISKDYSDSSIENDDLSGSCSDVS